MKRVACLLVAALTLALPAVAAAAPCPRTSLAAVENDVMCLECGTPLAVAEDGPAAQREIALINGLVAECRTKKQIENALVAQYGDRVLALPRAHGFALSAYVVPLVALIAGLALVGTLVLRWRRARPPRQTGAAGAAPAADAARLEADLNRYTL